MTKNRIRIICIVMVMTMAVLGVVAFADGVSESQQIAEANSQTIRIDQIEQERISADVFSLTEDNLQAFTQNGPLNPAVYDDGYGWIESNDNGTGLWTNIKNVRDKIVTVKNVGDAPAYFRTVIALEADKTGFNDLIKMNLNTSDYYWNPSGSGDDVAIIEDVPINYTYDPYPNNEVEESVTLTGVFDIIVGTYKEAIAVNTISKPSLLQVAMHKDAKTKQIKQFGNSYEILVYTQAVAIGEYTDPAEALDAKFGIVDAHHHPWIQTSAQSTENTSEATDASTNTQ